jgi:uncharacterized protein
MRLTDYQRQSLLEVIQEFLPGAEPYLFGSRVNDSAQGGDIDILLLTDEKLPLRRILTLRRKILDKIGDQKLDIANYSKDSESPFKSLILESAVRI